MLPAPVGPLLEPALTNLEEAVETEVTQKIEVIAAAPTTPPSRAPMLGLHSSQSPTTLLLEEATEDPSILPEYYQTTPLFGHHEVRNELEYDEVTGRITADEHIEERPVSPLELFFDLFFAALLSKLGHVLAEHLDTHPGQVLGYYILIFQLVYQNWLQVTSFINRFASESISDKAFVGWNLVGLGGVSINVSRCMGSHHLHDCSALTGWMALGRAGVCLWFLLTMKHAWQQHSEKGYHFSRISFTTNLVSVVLMGIASVCYQFHDLAEGPANKPSIAVVFLILTAVLDVVHIPFLWSCLPFYRKSYVPVNSNLASERFGLIYIVSLGELVLRAVSMTLHTYDEMAHVVRVTAIMLLGVLTGLLFQSAFFGLYDLQADHAKKHALEVSVLRQWAILHVTSLLALLASLVAAIFARLSLGMFTPTDRLTLWLTFAFKILLFSGSNLLYLRHVRVAYGWVADLMAVFLLIMLGMVLPQLVHLGDVVFVGLAIGIWALLAFVRGVVLPVRLTSAGEEELHTLSRERQKKREKMGKWKRRFSKLPFLVFRRGNGVGSGGGGGDKEGGAAAAGGGGRGRDAGGGRGRGGRGGRR